jgi:hypothetical protein
MISQNLDPQQFVFEHNRKVERTNLHVRDVIDVDLSIEDRRCAFEKALNMWPEGSFERNELLRRYDAMFQSGVV